jgi:hypothetical protein
MLSDGEGKKNKGKKRSLSLFKVLQMPFKTEQKSIKHSVRLKISFFINITCASGAWDGKK